MDYQEISKTIGENATELVSMGGKIHPYAGAGIALLLVIAMIWLGFKVKKQVWGEKKAKAGEAISGTGDDQKTADGVQSGIDDFLDKEGKNEN